MLLERAEEYDILIRGSFQDKEGTELSTYEQETCAGCCYCYLVQKLRLDFLQVVLYKLIGSGIMIPTESLLRSG